MSALAIQATPQDAAGQQAADAQQHRQALRDLINMGTDLARVLHGQAMAQDNTVQHATDAPPAPAPTPDTLINLAAAFDRISRAVRRCILLMQTLDRPKQPAPDPARERTAARKQIIREVEDRIGRTEGHDTESTAADLHAELRDRLDAPDLNDDLATSPVAEIITEICRDLGIASPPGHTPWRRRTPADLTLLRARAAAPTPARPGAGPQGLDRGARQGEAPRQPARAPTPCEQPGPIHTGPIHTGNSPPEDPAAAIAAILRHTTPGGAPWRPPPGD